MSKENFLKGALGGFVGSLVGVVAILFFYKLGYVAAAAGLIMAVCTINLYKKFAGGIGKKGVITCIVIMIVMTIVGNNLAFSFAVVEELKSYYDVNGDVTYIFFNLYSLMSEGLIEVSTYVGDLIMIVLFNIMGAIGILKNQFKKIKISSSNNNHINYNTPNYTNGTFSSNQNGSNNINVQNNPDYNYGYTNNNNLRTTQNQIYNGVNQNNNITNDDNFGSNHNNMNSNNMM